MGIICFLCLNEIVTVVLSLLQVNVDLRLFMLFALLSSLYQLLCLHNLQKRYSLKPGPPKKDPKVKGVNSSAVQAFLKKQENEQKKKGNSMKLI